MKILVLNCGSSSIKFQFFNMENQTVLAKGLVEKVGLNGSQLKLNKQNGEQVIFQGEIVDHKSGIEYVLGVLTSQKHGCIASLNDISAVGHRVVHGGELFSSSVLITQEVVNQMEKCIDLAPLHNPPNLKGIEAITELIPEVPQVGVFDTAFHQSMPDYAYMYGIPYALYKKYGIRRYGFHGTSHRYVSQRACEMLNIDFEKQKIITCHLGNGSSIAAIQNGKSVDTSMGFTPIEGLLMGTRAGDLDIGAVLYIMEKENIGVESASALFNKHSGLLGITNISSDLRDVLNAAQNGNQQAVLSLKMFNYRIRKYIGSYAAAMNGCDLLIFTGGIGENSKSTRAEVCKDLKWLGFEIDEEKNSSLNGTESVISLANSKVKVLIVPTDEELMIARDTQKITQEKR
ncbi:MAG TPA: acetate kinase [Prolixibacteraceae bacterium]|mgnify:CR=1 FL=1|nr:acetate kinase [Prolixibacteraceae bacterium]HPR59315.1 acetate kinase [Prolixibacteraceae bacterium]